VSDLTSNGTWETFQKIFKVLMITFVFVLVASYLLAMFLGLELFFFTLEGRMLSMRVYSLPILLFLIFQFETPLMLNLGLIFLFIWSIYLLCFIVAWMWRERFHKVVSTALLRPVSRLFRNFLFALPIIASMLLLAVIGIHYFPNGLFFDCLCFLGRKKGCCRLVFKAGSQTSRCCSYLSGRGKEDGWLEKCRC